MSPNLMGRCTRDPPPPPGWVWKFLGSFLAKSRHECRGWRGEVGLAWPGHPRVRGVPRFWEVV